MPKGQVYDPARRRQVAEMHRAGNTIREISTTTGVPRRTIYRWLNWPITKIMGPTTTASSKGTHEHPID